MHKVAKTIIILLFAIVTGCSSRPTAPWRTQSENSIAKLVVPFHAQNTPVWCWAATIAMVVDYVHGYSIDDCQVLSEYDKTMGGLGRCCIYPAECFRAGSTLEMTIILREIYNVHSTPFLRPLSFGELRANIDRRRPMIAALQKPSGWGHVVVIAGYSYDGGVYVLDPIFKPYWVHYNVLVANWGYGIWTQTITIGT